MTTAQTTYLFYRYIMQNLPF